MRWAGTLAAAGIVEAAAHFLSLSWGFGLLVLAFAVTSLQMAAASAKSADTEKRVNALIPAVGAVKDTADASANTLANGTSGAANNNGRTSGPQNYGSTSGPQADVGRWDTSGPSMSGNWNTGTSNGDLGSWNSGGPSRTGKWATDVAAGHSHVCPVLPSADHVHVSPYLPGVNHYHTQSNLAGGDHTHEQTNLAGGSHTHVAANDGHTHAMEHGHPLT